MLFELLRLMIGGALNPGPIGPIGMRGHACAPFRSRPTPVAATPGSGIDTAFWRSTITGKFAAELIEARLQFRSSC